ncbi:metallophosphoesterase family protein [Candidatus Woesearchaeota archaeon]|nr:metallophosphoesterase family protein [Candidatus Woesearchaeota archaeon]
MKILASGDIHGDMSLVKKLADRAEKEKVDLVVLCGDLTMFEQSTKNIVGPFINKKKKVLLIPGNHESVATTDFLAQLYGATSLHGYSIKYKDIGLFGCGGADIGPVRTGEDEIKKLLQRAYDGIKGMKKKIMVTHAHPSGTIMEKLSDFVPGSPSVREAVEKFKPDVLLCSHVHEAEGMEEKIGKTRVINVGKAGMIIDL